MQTSSLRRWTLPFAVVAASALVLSACGGASSTANSATSAAGSAASAATSAAASAASGATGASSSAGSSAASSPAASGGAGSSSAAVPDGDPVSVTLITKDSTNPFWIAMQEGAQKAVDGLSGVTLTIAAGKADGDEQGQVDAIEQSIARGDKGILVTPNGPAVNPAIEKARAAGLFVIALDTPPDPADTVDITFATDNFAAGNLVGEWAKGQLAGGKATIALLDAFNDKIITVDVNRDQGFLSGMGIDVADKTVKGDEAKSGSYDGGEYEIACQEASQATPDGGKTAMETCLSGNPDINVVYTINEQAAIGAASALAAAGKTDTLVVSVDGGCEGVSNVKNGTIGATSQQYPLLMAQLGVNAIVTIARGGAAPAVTEGLDFYDTGVALVTDKPVDGVESIDTTEGTELCWG